MRIQQEALHQELRAESTATRERIAALLKPLDLSRINEHPEPEGWSVGQVLEHLIRGNEAYEGPLAKVMRAARPDAGAPSREWKSSLIGGMIAGAILNPRPMKVPRVFLPGATPRNGVVDAFLAGELNLLNTMDKAASLDWRALRIGSPALPAWVPKMNLGDAFRILVVHATRHSHQIERLVGKAAPAFVLNRPL